MMTDTINYRKYSGQNDGFKYIMILIDVFSKRAFAAPMKKINDFNALLAMERMLKQVPEIPESIISDRGTEYYNAKMNHLFDRYGINHYSIRGPHKAAVAERFIRTIKGRIEKYFYASKIFRWLNILDAFIENYNNTYHRSIEMAPNEVNEANSQMVFDLLYPQNRDARKPRLQIGDRVRILKPKTIFDKGYTRAWSEELYVIKNTFTDGAVDYYTIEDLNGEEKSRKKYFWELNLVAKNAR